MEGSQGRISSRNLKPGLPALLHSMTSTKELTQSRKHNRNHRGIRLGGSFIDLCLACFLIQSGVMCSGDVAAHSELDPPMSIKIIPHRHAIGQSNIGNPSIETYFLGILQVCQTDI